MMDEETKRLYLEAYQEWQRHLQALHHALLEGQALDPPRLKALLSREARAKERYEEMRRRLLGLSSLEV